MLDEASEHRWNSNSLYGKLLRSHLIVALFSVVILCLSLISTFYLQQKINVLTNQRLPATLASEQLILGVNRSIAALRGWAGLGDTKLHNEWLQAWREDIAPAKESLLALLKSEDPLVRQFPVRLQDLYESQWWVADIANSMGNRPLHIMHETEIKPLLKNMNDYLRYIISTGYQYNSNSRDNQLFRSLIELKESLVFLEHGLVQFEANSEEYYTLQLYNELRTFSDIFNKIVFSNTKEFYEEIAVFQLLKNEFLIFEALCHQLIEIKETKSRNIADNYMKRHSVPVAAEINQLVKKISVTVTKRLRESLDTLLTYSMYIQIFLMCLIIFTVLSAIRLAHLRTMEIVQPVKTLLNATKHIAQGNLKENLPVVRNDEIGELTQSFNDMRNALLINRQEIEITHANLRIRSRALDEANRELEAYSATIAHDLRQPLRGIDGYSHILLSDYQNTLDEQGKDYLQRLRSGVQRLGVLMEEMLRLSRITRQDMEFVKIDLAIMAENIVQRLIKKHESQAITLVCDKQLEVIGDAKLMQIVLQELIDNAWCFTRNIPDAKVTIGEKQDNGSIVYFVKDNGAGFDIENVEHPFRAFQHAQNTQKKNTGSGLAAVARVIHRHNGQVWMESQPGRGTTVYFTLNPDQ